MKNTTEIGVKRSHVAVWTWVQKFGQRLSKAGRRPAADLPAVVLTDETAFTQHGKEFTLFEAVDPETRNLLHTALLRRATRSQRGGSWSGLRKK